VNRSCSNPQTSSLPSGMFCHIHNCIHLIFSAYNNISFLFRIRFCHIALVPGKTSHNLPQKTVPLKNGFRQEPPVETVYSRHRHADSISHAKHQVLLFRLNRPHFLDFQTFFPHRNHICTIRNMWRSVLYMFLKARSGRYTYPDLIHHPHQQMQYMHLLPPSDLYFSHQTLLYFFRDILLYAHLHPGACHISLQNRH